jgi:HAE1 family hydrophobic/amphiphilic exporter-1/multidrug efflux pump
MSPIEAAIKGSNDIFFCNFDFYHISSGVLPVIFLEGFVGDCLGTVIELWCIIYFCESLTLTPMLNAYLMKGGEQKKSKFYIRTEPYFQKIK